MSLFRSSIVDGLAGLASLVVLACSLASCGPAVEKRACMKMGSSDALVTGAALLRLDVYGASTTCVGGSVAAGAGAPLMSHTYARGQAITLEVPPGPHTLVLTTYADAGGTVVLGEGCTQATLTPGAQICFELAVAAPKTSDMAGGASCDPVKGLGCAGGLTCCNNICVDTMSNTANCGGCGKACDQTNSFGASCVSSACVYTSCRSGWSDCLTTAPDTDGCETHVDSDVDNCGQCGRDCKGTPGVASRHCTGGLCDSTCTAGSANCSMPAAPTADNGCETNAYDPAHCGTSSPAACSNMCSYGHATALCPAGACELGGCANGYYDCNLNPADGCEAPGPASAPGCCTGTTATVHGTKMTEHDNIVGQKFFDCAALNTYDLAEATSACTAYASAHGGSASNCTSYSCAASNGTGNTPAVVCSDALGTTMFPCYCWGFLGMAKGLVDNVANDCACPNPGAKSPAWH